MKKIQPKSLHLWVVEIITALLIVFFVHSAIDNYFRLQSLKNLLIFYTVNVDAIAWLILLTETAIALLLLFQRTRTAGLLASLAFFITLTLIVALTPHSPHNFGGVLNGLNRKRYVAIETGGILLSFLALLIKYTLKILRNPPHGVATPAGKQVGS